MENKQTTASAQKKPASRETIGVRVTPAMRKRAEALADLKPQLSDVLRRALELGLEALEHQAKEDKLID